MQRFLNVIIVIALGTVGAAAAQQSGFARIALQTQDVCGPGKVAVQVRGEFDPGVATGRHTHPGEEITYILEGQIELHIEGQLPRVIKAGETLFVPAGVVHEGINTGSGKATGLATYIVDKGQPLAQPAK